MQLPDQPSQHTGSAQDQINISNIMRSVQSQSPFITTLPVLHQLKVAHASTNPLSLAMPMFEELKFH